MKAVPALLLAAAIAAAQAPPPTAPPPGSVEVQPKKPYTSDKAQLLVERENNVQITNQLAQTNMQNLQRELGTKFAEAEKDLHAWESQVRKDNDWDATYTYDRQGDKWYHVPKPAAPKPAPAPAAKEQPKP